MKTAFSNRNYAKMKRRETFLATQKAQIGSCILTQPTEEHKAGCRAYVLSDPLQEPVRVLVCVGRTKEPSHYEDLTSFNVRSGYTIAKNYDILENLGPVELNNLVSELDKILKAA